MSRIERVGRSGGKTFAARLLGSASLTAVALLALSSSAHAQDQDRYWDANGAQPGSGGSGNWDTSTKLWSEANSDVLGPYDLWVNNAVNPDNAIFGVSAAGVPTTVGTITLTTPIIVHDLTFQKVNGWILNGSTLTLSGAASTINTLANATINSVLAGTSGLVKTGGNTLTLNGVNTFSGGITLSGGALVANTDAALGASTNDISVTASSTLGITAGTTNRTVDIAAGATLTLQGVGSGSALYTGDGNINVGNGIHLTNDASTYTGTTRFNGCNGVCAAYFSSIGDLGVASSLGAPTDAVSGTVLFAQSSQYSDSVIYTGDGDSSNRNWSLVGSSAIIRNQGTGTLEITGNVTTNAGGGGIYSAESADFRLLGTLSGNNYSFTGNAGRKITLGGANDFTGTAAIGPIMVEAPVLANMGVASSLGAGTTAVSITGGGTLSYTGGGASSDRPWSIASNSGGIANDGTGALNLSGDVALAAAATNFTLGGTFGGTNTLSGAISGAGSLIATGSGTWTLGGVNTFTGNITVSSGTLQAGSASAFGNAKGITVNGGTLDLNNFSFATATLGGTGGAIALGGSGALTVNGTAASSYAGAITGGGGLTKEGSGTLTLTGASTYSGGTTIGGGTLALDFSGAGGPASNILADGSTLNMSGGTLRLTGAGGEANSQSFGTTNITAGSNTLLATSGSGGSATLDLGTINRTGGLVNFVLPTDGSLTTANTDGVLGGWATINGTDYAKVVGGAIVAFDATDYTTGRDDAGTWQNGEIISDADGNARSFFGTLASSIEIGGLKYSETGGSSVTIAGANRLAVDGTILVGSTVGTANQVITGGFLTGSLGGGTLGIQQNGGGTFTIASTITDNGGAISFVKGGTGTVQLTNANNDYTGGTTLSGGRLEVTSLANGGIASSIGASSADSSNLVLEAGTLAYTGGTDAVTDRGFTLVNGGAGAPTISVGSGRTVEFSGQVTSPDDAGLTKTGWGTLVLSNPNNDYVGVTTIDSTGNGGAGAISVSTLANGGVASGIGAASSDSANLVLTAGGRLQYTGGTVAIDRGFTVTNGGGRIDVSQATTTLTVSGTAVGTGQFVKDGAGTLILSGANSYTGGTIANAGTLVAGSGTAFGGAANGTGAGTLTVNSGATVDLADNSVFVGGLDGSGDVLLGSATLNINAGGSFAGTISGSGGISVTRATQTMTDCNNDYTGVTSITSTLSVNCLTDGGQASGIGAASSDPANLVINGTLIYTGGTVAIDRGFTTTGQIAVNDANATLTISGATKGTSLTKDGAGTLVLSGASTRTGTTQIQNGTLRIGGLNVLGSGGVGFDNTAGAVLDLAGFDTTVAFLSGGGTAGGAVTLNGADLTIGGGSAVFAGVISGSGSFAKTVGGTQTLSGCSSTYDGVTTVSGGVLAVNCLTAGGTASSIGASSNDASNLVLDGGTLRYVGSGGSTDRLFTLGASTTSALDASGGDAIVFTNTGPIAFSSADTAQRVTLTGTSTANNILAAQLTDNGAGKTSLSKTGTGTWILTNQTNSYTGATSITGGVLGVDKLANGGEDSSIGRSAKDAVNLVIGTGGTLRYTGAGDVTDRQFTLGVGTTAIESSGSGAIQFTNTGAISFSGSGARVISLGGTYTGANIMAATITNQGANVTSLAKSGSGTWILTGDNTFSGSTVINDGDLVIGNGGTTGNAGTGNVIVDQATSTLSFNRSDTFNFTGTISGPGSIAQIGTGTTVLTASNTIGAARVDDGTLQVDGALQTATFAMNGDGALSVNGTVQGATAGATTALTGDAGTSAVKVNAGGTLRAAGDLGDGADTLTLAGLIDTGAGSLSLGAGDDTMTLSDGGTITGTVDAGAGTDTLIVNNAAARTLEAARAVDFEALDKQNTGTLTLVGDHSYSAGTTIEEGTLSVGGGGTTGTLAGNVVDNGALVFNRSDLSTFGGNITGSGSLTKLGGGTLTLTGDATHTGGTTISAGTLSIGNGGTTGSIAGNIVDNASLNFARSDGYTYAGAISGSGSVTTRNGVIALTGNSSYGGATSVVDGSELRIAAGNTVASGGSTIVNNGTLTVSGAGSTFVAGSANAVSPSQAAVIDVSDGGTLRTTTGGLAIRGTGSPSMAQLTISGPGSLVDLAGALTAATTSISTASFTISGGGTLRSAGANTLGNATGNNTASSFTITGAGSNWTSTGTLSMADGSLSLLDGGAASFASATIGSVSALQPASVRVSGANSRLTTAGDLTLGSGSGTGVLTLADGGQAAIGGSLVLGDNPAGTGVLNIGGAEAEAPAAAGALNAASLALGSASSRVNFNHTEANYDFATAISGVGAINQLAGVTRLTGDSSGFSGTAMISGGALFVDGTLGDATSATTVLGGGTLGGSGTIGGDVQVGDGAILAPGSNGVGALTINGSLALSNASQVRFEFGQPNAAGGPLNDLVNVGGNLTLDGTVDVTEPAGGSFGPGVYRMFNYAGTLTDNGLTVGSLPSGTAFVQTAVANQVNLVNTAGLTLNFWDGAVGPKNDGAVNGGTGTWRLGGGENDWTGLDGLVNADYAQDSFAIFQGTGGTVTIDNGAGNVLAAGMQFTSDGYRLVGGPLTLTGTQAFVRVGDGGAGDAGITTTIDAVLTGAAGLVKDMGGTLVLTGANSYAGGTAIDGGTLRISADANLGDAAGGLGFDGGTLNTTATFGSSRTVDLVGAGTILTDAGTTLTLGGLISGAGALTKGGAGSLVLAADEGYAGGTTISAGTLQLGDGGVTGSIQGDVTDDGVLAFNRSNSLIFAGAITGSGAVSQIGSGVLTLTADNSYTGGTTISAGALQLGNDGATGSITGDVVNDSTLIFNRSNEYSFAGTISGGGIVRQEGTGTTILIADNSYTGSTVISSGALLVNGNQTAANGTTNVLGGGALGGTGTIGGDVLVGGGATLTPGDATGPGTLTINGNLGFSPNATLAYEFGQSNIVGGPLNDLTQVAGDLSLDGTIDVTVSAGGSFGPGLYRVISYGGALTNNGLDVGVMPAGSTVAVQTSIDGQVNLVNAAGGTFNFWDGAAAANESNNSVDGGDGIWQNSSGNNDWTTADGAVSGAYTDGTFAIFAAAPGTVEIDNGLGAVTASGLQFASDGYTITGQDLTLVGPESVIRVGDGTAAGLGMTATIDSRIVGDTQLVKADLGTLVLGRANAYTGGTRIDAGTIRISSDVQLGDAAGALSLNGGTLNTTVAMAIGRAVNLLSTGTLLTDAGTSLTLFGTVSGAGGFTKAGTGILMLTGNNSFGGDVDVTAGSLFVNGDQSAATGATSVASGAALAGSGIIGGNVALADGATLDPGGTLFGVGTLTINGNLALSSGSALDFQFGQANVAGGALNDLVNVGGDLTLDGTINVTEPAGGSFGPGIYRVFNYGGTLTDNGLTLGTMPGGSAVAVQTAVAGQVNLVNTAGLSLSFWDGNAGPKNDGTVNGGNGVWRVGGGSNDWTDLNGSVNADYAQNSFAIFSAAPGTVTVDNGGGDVLASGLQFASDGYTIAGDALTLTGAQAIVQVGDGSAASATYTATIANELTGSAGLVKTDAGRLILTGANSYTGGTTIDDGTLQIGNGGVTGSITGDITNDGALVVDRSDTLTLDGAISGSGSLTVLGGGTTILSGANSYAGGTLVSGATLQVSSDANLGDVAGTLSLQGGTLQAGASFTSARDILVGSSASNRIDTQGFDVTLTGTIGNGANNQAGNFLDKVGSGTLTLTGANIYANRTVIGGGTLALAGAGTAGVGNIIVGAGTVFDISQTDTGARVIQLNSGPAGTIALGSKVLTLGLSNSFSDWSGTITDGGIAGGTGGSVVIAAFGGAVRYFEANSYTGGTTVLSGSFELAGNGSLYSGGAVTVNNGAIFSIAGLTGPGTTIGDLSGGGAVSLGGKTLTFGTGNDARFSGPISGTGGALVKNGTGTFTVSGANSYTGATDVNAGTLLVNGNQSAATGLTTVASGAALGGTGTIGGDVVVADGARLTPGAGGAGALTINGDLSLGSGSSLAFDFGRANAPGDPLNDVVNIGGDLTLDGTLDVAVTPGGAFDIGLYRIANYGGTLTDNGLALGTLPAGADVFVQTSVANQVNLINRGGATLNFWDGAAGPKFNDAVNGGDGVWQASTGNDNWADATGAVNAGYDDGAFAIFSGTAGTVAIDNSLGAVTASGLQFAADGYTITGEGLTLGGPQSVIRVGDGTAAGAGYTATIASAIGGNTQLVKSDAGTLVLTGANSYTGGTVIDGGTLRIASDANLGDAAGGLSFNGGTLNTTADLSSARAVDLAGAGTFLTDPGTTLTLTGALSGAGALTKGGEGTLVLAGTGTNSGAVAVDAGTLLVDGDFGGATGAASVASGAALGGSGTIGGNVAIADGATLTPGHGGAGTLTIGGDLTLASGSRLAFEFGEANVAGGALNDLVNVGGNLTLDGTIDVTVPTGGAFDTGVYRVFNYGGTLTDNGLTVGTLPGGGSATVQTSIAGQVNLVNSAGLTLNFWDGAAGPKDDGVINGGDGIWQAATGNDNWTDASGRVNAGYSDGAFAVFGGTGGTVTVDNSLGQVTSGGMQFAADGYTVTGDGLALTDPQTTIRVGDGSAAGAGFTATIGAALSGDSQLVKTDAGTLVLSGANSYTGGTAINGGTLRISTDANLGDAAGGLSFDGGTLNTTASFSSGRAVDLAGAGTILTDAGTTLTLSGLVSGTGALAKGGSGTLLLTADNSYSGGTTIAAGTLQLGNGGTTGSIAGDIVDNGTLVLDRANLLTLGGAISGSGSLDQIGTGTTVLTGTNGYAGGTTIAAGTLQLGDGGTTGSIAGNVANNGTLAFDRSNAMTFAGTISGSGSVVQAGSGATTLTGANSYKGATSVTAGTLLVNGDQSAATGLTSVAAGATLGGAGTIGGDVAIADGGTIAAGSNGVGVLTIKGDLALGAASRVNLDFGQANVVGGPLNDLIQVAGDLTLDGTLDVAVTPGGAFGVGLYRVANYGGTLTDNGLALGTMPAGAKASVQTSIAGQVNLVNSAGVMLNFWDGAAGPKDDGAINGGDGIWQSSGGNDNWTDAAGKINAPYAADVFAVFAGTGGTVTIDDSLGAVTASGLQFAADGYTIAGDTLDLAGPQAIVRVGDGSSAGADYTATIDATLAGSTSLVKTDAGTLVLGGANSYTGGTVIQDGTLQISSDGNLGAASGGVTFDGGTLATTADLTSGRHVTLAGAGTISTADQTTLTLDGVVSGGGALVKAGAGTLLLTGDDSGFTGPAIVAGGTLAVTGNFGGPLGVSSAGRLEGTGYLASVTNAGTVAPGRGGFGTLTLSGDYTGAGGRLEIETALGGDTSATDLLVVNGATAGATTVDVVNRGGLGAATTNGIKIIDVNGASNGTFVLNGDYVFDGDQAVIAGAYGYRLYQGGTATPTDGDWYLRSSLLDAPGQPDQPPPPLYQPGVPVYEAYGQTLLTLNDIGTMQERIGNRQWAETESGRPTGIWGHIQTSRSRPNAAVSTSLSDVNVDSWKLEAGADRVLSARGDGASLVLGVIGGYGEATASVASPFGNGTIRTRGYSAGATLSWYGPKGFYVDSRAQFTWFESNLKSAVLGTLVHDNDGTGQAYSVEVGKRAPVGGHLSVTPQIQMTYSTVGFDRFTDPNAADVSSKLGDSLKTRWGLSVDRQDDRSHLYAVGNVTYEWLDGTVTDVSGTPIARANHRLWGELGVGGSVRLGGRLTLYSEASATTAIKDFGKSYGLKGVAGLRLAF